MAYCKNCINAVKSNLPEGGLYCRLFRSLCGDTIGCSNGVDGERKAKTNADRIRAMTDKELAEFCSRAGNAYPCPPGKKWPHACEAGCGNCWLNWLKQETE